MADKYVCTLSAELQEKAKKELFEKEEWRNRDIQALRERVLQNKALTSRTDAHFLLRFLRARKFDYERSYKLLENYFRIRAENQEHFKDLSPSKVTHVWDAGITMLLPQRDTIGRRIMYFRPGKWDPSKFNVYEILKANAINMELAIQDEATQIHGVVLIGNAEGVGWDHAKNLSRDYFKLMTSLMQEAAPIRLKKINIMQEPTVIQYVFALARPFLKEKTASRIQFHGHNLDSLFTEESGLTKDVLPAELGGSLPHGDELAKTWRDHVMSKEQYFLDQQQYKIVLPRNISSSSSGAQGDVSGCTGITGTFKKLNVD